MTSVLLLVKTETQMNTSVNSKYSTCQVSLHFLCVF